MEKLITSSHITLQWLNKIKMEITKKASSMVYNESKYWASFRSLDTKRNIVYLSPQKGQIRVFTTLKLAFDSSLRPSPSSSTWARNYPSIFLIRSENSINKAIDLIISSYKHDLNKHID